jgi:diguanylate cyclase (GGDEF)-like protein
MGNFKKARSLRSRYFVTTFIVSVLLLAVSLYNHSRTLYFNDEYSRNLSLLDGQLSILEQLHHEVAHLYQLLDQFLIDPTQKNIKLRLETEGLGGLDEHLGRIRAARISSDPEGDLKALYLGLDEFKSYVHQAVETRLNTGKQYPAMALSAEDMSASQKTVISNLQLLTAEIENGELVPTNPGLYPQLLKAQTIWANCISQMRIYLANRLASFTTEILLDQARSLDDLMTEFVESMDVLRGLYAGEESFEAQELIPDTVKQATDWYEVFTQVRSISESEGWRADSYLMETRVIPLVSRLHIMLEGINARLKGKRSMVAESLAENRHTQDLILLGFLVVFVLFVSAFLVSMEFMIFRPVSKVTQALKSRAFGIDNPQFYRMLSSETQQLVDAFEEMNTEVRQHERALEHQALHDPLTTLPNRFMLTERLNYHLFESKRGDLQFALFLIDLDEFKEINDSLGHQVGDSLLVAIAEMLRGSVRSMDTTARLGGDEFAVLLPRTEPESAVQVAEKISACFKDEFQIGEYSIKADASIGIALFPEHGSDSATLLQHADVAMYQAKGARKTYTFYDQESDDNSPDRIALVSDLKSAIEDGDLELYFQPQKDLNSGKIHGVEALLRWQHPKLGFINPERVVEIAERTGLIDRLTVWVMNKALTHCAEFNAAGMKLAVSVNISSHNLTSDLFVGQVEDALANSGLSAGCLTLEVTETAVMTNTGRAVDMLKRLAESGISMSIDDYGTGFSSLSYLKQLPVNGLKIDKSFVMHMDQNKNDEIIVKSTIDLGHNLGLKVVAEGIESNSVEAMLRNMGCDSMQGYYLAKPMAKSDFIRWMRRHPAQGA